MSPKRETRILAIVGTGASLVAAGLEWTNPGAFSRIFGPAPGWTVVPLALALGVLAAGLLRRRSGVRIAPERPARAFGTAAAIALVFAVVVTVADLILGFPKSINQPLPLALAYYPVMGLVAESLFHLVPLALVSQVRRDLFGWRGLAAVALIEALFQAPAILSGRPLDLFVFGHVLAFNLAQMWLLRRHGLATAFTQRIVYYAWWHLAWGWLRLHLG